MSEISVKDIKDDKLRSNKNITATKYMDIDEEMIVNLVPEQSTIIDDDEMIVNLVPEQSTIIDDDEMIVNLVPEQSTVKSGKIRTANLVPELSTVEGEEKITVNLMPEQSMVKVDTNIKSNDSKSELGSECFSNQEETCNKVDIILENLKVGNIELFTEDTGPQMYNTKSSPVVTAPIITKNLPKAFECYLPIFGKPEGRTTLKGYHRSKIREFVGCDLDDYEYNMLEKYCSPDLLKTGKELMMRTNVPVMGVVAGNIIHNNDDDLDTEEPPDLCILKKNKMRNERDSKNLFSKKLKYRGVRILPFTKEVYDEVATPAMDVPDVDLEPGKDVLYRVRVYRPYNYSMSKDRFTRTRHSVFCCDIVLSGRHRLCELRDRFVCYNDFDMRVDVSNNPDNLPNTKAKEVFPSGFLFINNVFYVDTRDGCIDYSEPIRAWAIKRKIGVFPKRDMCTVTLGELVLKLGYPEVYVHQGSCEHVFVFSELRLLSAPDPLRYSAYPCCTAIAQNQTTYCTTCAEFPAKWIVVGCARVPFDPAFFCDACFKQYLYVDGKKIGQFKAYSYRGNAMNPLKPQ